MQLENLLQNSAYKTLMQEHIRKTIDYLFTENQPFAIRCETAPLTFSPQLPQDIYEGFDESVLFILQNYSFESAMLQEELTFEAGFGSENFGATVYVPLLAIKEVYINDVLILLNLSQYEQELTNEERSIEMLLKNPKNRSLLKK
jgi:hypothetical protein